MKTEVRMPLIRQEDYKAFRAVLEDNVPNTYEEWAELILDRGKAVLRNGEMPLMQAVDFHEFEAWLSRNRDQDGPNALFVFAAIKAKDRK